MDVLHNILVRFRSTGHLGKDLENIAAKFMGVEKAQLKVSKLNDKVFKAQEAFARAEKRHMDNERRRLTELGRLKKRGLDETERMEERYRQRRLSAERKHVDDLLQLRRNTDNAEMRLRDLHARGYGRLNFRTATVLATEVLPRKLKQLEDLRMSRRKNPSTDAGVTRANAARERQLTNEIGDIRGKLGKDQELRRAEEAWAAAGRAEEDAPGKHAANLANMDLELAAAKERINKSTTMALLEQRALQGQITREELEQLAILQEQMHTERRIATQRAKMGAALGMVGGGAAAAAIGLAGTAGVIGLAQHLGRVGSKAQIAQAQLGLMGLGRSSGAIQDYVNRSHGRVGNLVMTDSEMLHIIHDEIGSGMGSGDALKMFPAFARVIRAASIFGKGSSKDIVGNLSATMEAMNVTKPADRMRILDLFEKAQNASGGRLSSSWLKAFSQKGFSVPLLKGVAPDRLFGILDALSTMGPGSSAGMMINNVYSDFAKGGSSNKAAAAAKRYGLNLKQLATQDPLTMANSLMKHFGMTDEMFEPGRKHSPAERKKVDAYIQALLEILPNKQSSRLMLKLAGIDHGIATRAVNRMGKAGGFDATGAGMAGLYQNALDNQHAAWERLEQKTAKILLPDVTRLTESITKVLTKLEEFESKHPNAVRLAARLALLVPVITAVGGVIVAGMGIAVLAGASGPLGIAAIGITALGTAIVALAAILSTQKVQDLLGIGHHPNANNRQGARGPKNHALSGKAATLARMGRLRAMHALYESDRPHNILSDFGTFVSNPGQAWHDYFFGPQPFLPTGRTAPRGGGGGSPVIVQKQEVHFHANVSLEEMFNRFLKWMTHQGIQTATTTGPNTRIGTVATPYARRAF